MTRFSADIDHASRDFGRVVGVHVRDEFLTDGKVDIARIKPLARLGYQDYTVAEKVLTLSRPKYD